MPALSVSVPFPVFQDRDGQPLDNGYVYIGTVNLDAQTNPVQVYFDEALTIPAAQPLRTINGYVSNAGTPAQLYVNAVNFSIKLLDAKGTFVYSFNNGTQSAQGTYTDWIADTFTGNGVQTLFVLERAPGSVGNCDVSVNGLTLVPNTEFSLSGAILTFVTAPANGATILVRYGAAATQISATFSTELQTATAGQTVFSLNDLIYNPGTNALAVYVNGLRMVSGIDFLETSTEIVTFTSGLTLGDEVLFIAGRTINESIGAEAVSYLPGGTGAVATTAQAKLRETVSVKDFGAVGDGVTDDWAAIQAAINYAVSPKRSVYFPAPASKYLISRPLVLDDGQQLIGESRESCVIEKTTTLGPSPAIGIVPIVRAGSPYSYNYDKNAVVIIRKPTGRAFPNGIRIDNLTLYAATGITVEFGIYAPLLARSEFNSVSIFDVQKGVFTHSAFMCLFNRIEVFAADYGFYWSNDGTGLGTGTSCSFTNCWSRTARVAGWSLYGLVYSSIVDCAAEDIQSLTAGSRPVAWLFDLCQGINVIGCGSEVVKGYVFRVNGGTLNISGGLFGPMTGDTFSGDTAIVLADGGSKISINGGTVFAPTTSPGNIYNEIVRTASQIVYDGTVTRPTGGNTNPLFTGGGEIVVLGSLGEGYTRQDSTGTYYAVESNTSGTSIPTANLTLVNSTSGFTFPCVLEPVAANRVLQWQNSSASATGGWEWYASNASYSKIRFGVYLDGKLRISPPTGTTVGAAGAASALPANPVGYITVSLDGTDRKIPYYNV